MSRPRVSLTVAGNRARSSAALKAAIAFEVEPSYIPVGLYGIRFLLTRVIGSLPAHPATRRHQPIGLVWGRGRPLCSVVREWTRCSLARLVGVAYRCLGSVSAAMNLDRSRTRTQMSIGRRG